MPEIWGIIITALLSALVGAWGGSWAVNRSTATKTEVEALAKIIETYRQERADDCKEIESLNDKVIKLKNELRTESDGREKDRKTIKTLGDQVEALQKELDTERSRRREIEVAKDKRIDGLQAEVEELQKQIEEMGGTPRKRKSTGPLD